MKPSRDDLQRSLDAERAARTTAERKLARLTAIQEIVAAALSTDELDELVTILLDRLRGALEADTARLLLLDEDTDDLVLQGQAGFPGPSGDVRIPLGCGFSGRIVAENQPVVLRDVSRAEIIDPVLRKSVRSLAGVPLHVEGRPIGVLHVGTREPREFDEEDVWLLRLVADRVAAAVARRHHARERRRHRGTELLAGASAILSTSLDLETTLARVLDVVVPALGDFGFFDLVEGPDRVRRMARASTRRCCRASSTSSSRAIGVQSAGAARWGSGSPSPAAW